MFLVALLFCLPRMTGSKYTMALTLIFQARKDILCQGFVVFEDLTVAE